MITNVKYSRSHFLTESRRLEVRCGLKSKDQTRKLYVHMLNGTLCATERALCCLVENYQTPEVYPDQPLQGTVTDVACRVYGSQRCSSRICKAATSFLG